MVVHGEHVVYTMEGLVTVQRLQVLAARMRPNAGIPLDMMKKLKEVTAHIQRKGEPRVPDGQDWTIRNRLHNVLVEWVGLEGLSSTVK